MNAHEPTPEDLARDLADDLAWLAKSYFLPKMREVAGAALRRALAAEAQVAALTGLDPADVNALLERYDLTAPSVRRAITAALAARAARADGLEDECARLRKDASALAEALRTGLGRRAEGGPRA